MDHWFVFTAYNSQAHYGYGTQEQADAYCDIINRNREFNVYSAKIMDDSETGALNSGDDTDGFELGLALDAQREQDEANAVA